jgi:hypothetical protein
MDDRSLALLVFKAIHALGIDVPIYGVVLLPDERLQLSLYGGRVVIYPPAPAGSVVSGGAAVTSAGASSAAEIRPKAEVTAAEALQPAAPKRARRPARRPVWTGPDREALCSDPLTPGKSMRTVKPEEAVVNGDIASPEIAIPAARDLEGMELVTLQDQARRKGIKVTRKMNRDALIKALRGVK